MEGLSAAAIFRLVVAEALLCRLCELQRDIRRTEQVVKWPAPALLVMRQRAVNVQIDLLLLATASDRSLAINFDYFNEVIHARQQS